MKRALLKALTLLSVLVALTTLTFWLTGHHVYFDPTGVWRSPAPLTRTGYSIEIGQGTLRVSRLSPPTTRPDNLGYFLGFAHYRGKALDRSNAVLGDIQRVYIPYWFLLLTSSALPAWLAFTTLRARLHIPPGLCRSCGYDLRASPTRCPECGTPATAETPSHRP